MTRQFCDRCDADISQKKSAAANIVGNADPQGNGTVTTSADLCQKCHRALLEWLRAPRAGVRGVRE